MQLKYLRHDLYRYFYPNDYVNDLGILGKIKMIIIKQGLWAIIIYRISRWAIYECNNSILKCILRVLIFPIDLFVQTITGIYIEPSTDIGPGLYIGHFGGIFTGGEVKIGKFCNLSQENAIGWAGRGEKRGLPEIGDFVYIGPGAKIIGKIKIGNNVAIGANAVVTKDLPDNAIAVGVPAKVISFDSSKDFIEFNKNKSREFL